jgi:hypothetical protein
LSNSATIALGLKLGDGTIVCHPRIRRDRVGEANRPTGWDRTGESYSRSRVLICQPANRAHFTIGLSIQLEIKPSISPGSSSAISNPMTGMATVRTNKIVIALQIALVSAVTFFALSGARDLFGRTAFWMFGLTLLFLAGAAFFRLRK